MRQLTGDTKIRLSQIVDLKDWVLEMTQDEAAPDGTIHHWSDGDHVKKNGKWVPVSGAKEVTMSVGNTPVKETSRIREFLTKHNKGVFPKTIEEFAKVTKSEIYNPEKSKLTVEQKTLINDGMKTLKEMTGSSFDNVLIIRNSKIVHKTTVAQMHPKYPGTIMINIRQGYWNNPAKRKFYLEQTSTKNPAHPFLHEEGHRRTKVKIKEWQGYDAGLAFFLSKIAMQSPEEFCAEYYAAKIAKVQLGETRQKIADALYKKYGGEA